MADPREGDRAGGAEAERDRAALTEAIARVAARVAGRPHDAESPPPDPSRGPPALDALAATFGLSGFERDVLVLTAGAVLDGQLARACGPTGPTFALALARLEGAHWSALAPTAPLRRWRLIRCHGQDEAEPLTARRLGLDERILHHLVGLAVPEARLHGLAEPLPPAAPLPPSQEGPSVAAATAWTDGPAPRPAILLDGADAAARRAVAADAARRLGLGVLAVDAAALPTSGPDAEEALRLCEREAAMGERLLLVEVGPEDRGAAARAGRFADQAAGLVVLSSARPVRPPRRAALPLTVPTPPLGERAELWRRLLPGLDAPRARALAGQFPASGARAQAAAALARAGGGDYEAAWSACRAQARAGMRGLAERIDARARWDDLVLPEPQRRALREATDQARLRVEVHDAWGFAERSGRGLGVSLLLSGPSGTGKTMAAEVVANALSLDLYRIDLSAVTSKYIGETEKNLAAVFDAAEAGGAVLLFDEADALFGKRSEVKDARDRYANAEVSYLLQRVETYRGVAVLTSNLEHAVDEAFLRRLSAVVRFPFPDRAAREAIWRRAFPDRTPTRGLDPAALASMSVTGGTIRTIALNAAFLAAAADEPVGMDHVIHAARGVHDKLGVPFAGVERTGAERTGRP